MSRKKLEPQKDHVLFRSFKKVLFWRCHNALYGGYGRAKELTRLHVIQKVLDGIIKQGEATEILPLSSRQIQWDKGKIRDNVIKRHRWVYQDLSPTLASAK